MLRDGLIEAVGKDVAIPGDARVWDLKGATIYAGFIDSYLVLNSSNNPVSTSSSEPVRADALTSGGINFFGAPGQKTDRGNPGPGYDVGKVTPDVRAVKDYTPQAKMLEGLRELGFTAGLVAPSRGIFRGTSALVALSDDEPNDLVLKADVFQHIAFETHQADDQSYPGSLMGVIATIRQCFFDARHYHNSKAGEQQRASVRKRGPYNLALEALEPVFGKNIPVLFEPGGVLMVSRAETLAEELKVDFAIVSCGQEWRRPDLIKSTPARFIVPLNFPVLPKLPSEDDWEQVSLDQLRAWDWAPENPALLRKQGSEIAFTTYGLADVKKFRENLRMALDRGLTEEDALAALTTAPAKLCGIEAKLGTIAVGKIANLVVVTGGSYFSAESKIKEVWIDGRVYHGPAEEPKKIATTEAVKGASPEEGSPTRKKDETAGQPKPPKTTNSVSAKSDALARATSPSTAKADKKKGEAREMRKQRAAHSPMQGRGPLAAPRDVLIRNATIWTCGPDGIITNGSLLVSAGKIVSVGTDASVPDSSVFVIDGKNMHVTPGIIDCHSHTAILGAVNESTLPSTAMVRIRDVVNSETPNLYQQLAGGVTSANLLHGSANPIGGQNCVIKFRDGAAPDQLIFAAAPQGIKFALGENVKQSNWGEKYVTRFPQTRMGVKTFIANRFTAAEAYLRDWARFRENGKAGEEPRRDLELEALGEIIEGKRLIHCHSYRQDEILMLIRLMESFHVQIASFQHVLEGYKVADEIARHGAGGSTFSDWWAYKYEVLDAIPYNGSLLHDRGVVVSFNSDSSELARRLYLEAAKAVKYGGTPEIEALKFVTLNPAKQLRIDKYVGSLEAGKDGDFVLWSKNPLDSGTVCLQTWVDGKKFFDRNLDAERTAKLNQERNDLLDKAKKLNKLAGGGDEKAEAGDKSFFRNCQEHEFDGQERHCLDEENAQSARASLNN